MNKPTGRLKEDIERNFDGYDSFFELLKSKVLQLKGSGYTFLVLKSNGRLDIVNSSNQEIPLLGGSIPLFNIDLWEHAYYLNYENDRAKHLDNFEKIADFTNASNIYNGIMKNKL